MSLPKILGLIIGGVLIIINVKFQVGPAPFLLAFGGILLLLFREAPGRVNKGRFFYIRDLMPRKSFFFPQGKRVIDNPFLAWGLIFASLVVLVFLIKFK